MVKVKENANSNKVMLQTKVSLVPYTETSTAGAIINYAEQNHIELIVIGTRGHSGLKKMLLGSVALVVLTYSHCPVMVIK